MTPGELATRRPVQDARATVRAVLLPEEMDAAARLIREQWPKNCRCGLSYGRWSWRDLAPRYQRTDEYSTNEARDCACGSTLEVMLAIHDPEAL